MPSYSVTYYNNINPCKPLSYMMVSLVVSSTSFPVSASCKCKYVTNLWSSKSVTVFARCKQWVSASQPVVAADIFSRFWSRNSTFGRCTVSISASQLVVPCDSYNLLWISNFVTVFGRCTVSVSASQPVIPFDSFRWWISNSVFGRRP